LQTLFEANQDRRRDYSRLANDLWALYPKPSEENRLPDAMLLTESG